MSKKVIAISYVAIIIVSIVTFIIVRNNLILQKEGININLKIGKNLHITVRENEIVDAEYLSRVADGRINDSPFESWDNEEMPKLIEYLKKNDFIIEPGKYTINQAWPFEKVRDILRFKVRN